MGLNLEIHALKKNGDEFPVDIGLSVLRTEEEYHISAAVRDITKRREVEKQMELDYFLQKALNEMLEISLEPLPLELQFEKILDLILATPHLALETRGTLYVAGDDKDVLVLKAARGFEESSSSLCREIPFGDCLCGRAASCAEIIHADQLDDRHTRHRESMFPHGHYCIPIVSGGRTIGLMNIYLKEGHKRSSREEQFLTSVAHTLALIINRHNSAEEREKLQYQLADSEKLAALGRFTANVAHEIRNPLTAIGGLARRLQSKVTEGTKENEYAGFIASEVTVLEKILGKVLTYSRETPLEREATNIHEIIDVLLKLNEDNFSDNNITVTKAYGTFPDLDLNKTEMHEAIENIIVNALDSMSMGGQLTIATGVKDVKEATCVFVRFQDTGEGMTKGQLNAIFEPFFTTKVSAKGTGLGLPITKKIVEDHGGFVTVESAAGRGSTFTLYFPLAQT
jgi:signal transduction histidine kinase